MISKTILKEILLEQRKNLEKSKKEAFVIREKLSQIRKFVRIKQIIVITGIRRCGKSVFLSQIIGKFFEKYYYVNFEDERLSDFTFKDFNLLYEVCIELFGKSRIFFLDEIQNVEGWERWVRRMYDNNFKFFITGSNARLLSKELATLLTGRHLQFSIYPFSFKESLDFYGIGVKENDIYLTEKRAIILKCFSGYLNKGGFPEFLKYKRIEILQEYFNSIIERDIVARYNIGNFKQIKELARFLITNTANLTTYSKLRRITEIKSVNTVIKYLFYLENSYLVFRVPFFSFSLKKQMANPFKVYVIDSGLRNAIGFTFSKDMGRIYETVTAIELKRRGEEVYYWKDSFRHEVDFVIRKGRKVKEIIQSCFSLENIETESREIRSLIKASKELNCNNLTVLTENYESEERVKWFGIKRRIKFIPLWKWILFRENL
ncbi:MAG: ATP-binding protein [Elusimicrobia bacterium]|nr:ATP-binding protein [Elusimicrobiota bacterium]